MDYANLPGLAAAGIGGAMIGAALGRKISSDLMKTVEARLASAERQFASINSGTTAKVAVAERYAGSIAKLASAIETHAAAIDDHGAAVVAAAVEGHAACEPFSPGLMTTKSPIA